MRISSTSSAASTSETGRRWWRVAGALGCCSRIATTAPGEPRPHHRPRARTSPRATRRPPRAWRARPDLQPGANRNLSSACPSPRRSNSASTSTLNGCETRIRLPGPSMSGIGRSAPRARPRSRIPLPNEPPPTLEQVRPGVGRLDLVLDHVSQRGLDHFPRMVGFLGRPVPERRPEAVSDGGDPMVDGTGASWAASTPRSASRSASGTRGRRRRRASAPRRGPPAPSRRAGRGARASPSSAAPERSTRGRPCPSRPTRRGGPPPTGRPSAREWVRMDATGTPLVTQEARRRRCCCRCSAAARASARSSATRCRRCRCWPPRTAGRRPRR